MFPQLAKWYTICMKNLFFISPVSIFSGGKDLSSKDIAYTGNVADWILFLTSSLIMLFTRANF